MALILLAILSAPAANALNVSSNWRPSSNPLVTTSNSRTTYSYGTFRVADLPGGDFARASGYVRTASSSGGYRAYYIAQFQSNSGRCVSGSSLAVDFFGTGGAFGIDYSCTRQFYNWGGERESNRTPYATWVGVYAEHEDGTDPYATIMRARVKGCIDIPLASDVCTAFATSGPDTY